MSDKDDKTQALAIRRQKVRVQELLLELERIALKKEESEQYLVNLADQRVQIEKQLADAEQNLAQLESQAERKKSK